MPSEHVAPDRPLIPAYPATHDQTADSILQSVKEQEAHFHQLSRELEAERQSVANQLGRYNRLQSEEENGITNLESEEDTYHWRQVHLDNSKMTDSHMPYTTDTFYSQERAQPVQSPYGMKYETSTNGHHRDGSVSPTSSQLSGPGENGALINRPTPQAKPQQMKPTPPPKLITTRLIPPDGQTDYPPYSGGPPPPPPAGDFVAYTYTPALDGSHDYGSYESGQPPSPAGQAPTLGYPSDYGTYRAVSPNSGQNFDIYAPRPGQGYTEYEYHEYPPRPPSPPSVASESPQPRRAMPQVPHGGEGEYNHRPAGYEDMDPSMIPPRTDYQERYPPTSAAPPPPPPPADRYGPYGYIGPQLPATSPGYTPYDTAPQGYLDRRPSYDEHPQSQGTLPRPPGPYPHPARPVIEEEPGALPVVEGQYMPPPRHPHLTAEHGVDGEDRDVRWRDPDLHEVIEFLAHPNNVVRANAAAYLQHLCYMDDSVKQKTRVLGGVPPLVDLLNQEIPEIQRNACGALRNLSFGRQNDENKRAIRNAGGIPSLVRLLRKTPDNEIRELITGILWNLSSCEELKRPIIDDSLTVLVNHVIVPHSGWDRNRDPGDQIKPHEIYWSTVFRNASGVLRNVSSAGEYARRKLRECESLVDSLLHLVRAAIGKNDMDNKSVENCVCILRNLSYRCQEVDDPDYDKRVVPPTQSRALMPIKVVGENLGCFGTSKKKKEAQNAEKYRKDTLAPTPNPHPRSEPAKGMELLWQPEVVQPYLALLSECSNPETLEAAAGGIQNLAACYWQPSIDIRAAVRKEKGLPILVELLRMEVDRVVCAVATALRNLAMDQRNKELIGKYAMKDLVQKLPNRIPQHDSGTSDDTIAAVLATLNEVIVKNGDFARSLFENGGVERLTYITKQKSKFSPRVVKFTTQLLANMWQHQELREVYRKAGWKESHFVTRSLVVRNASSPPGSANNTLSRPMSTQGGTNYEDRTLMRGRDLNSTGNPGSVPYNHQSEELPLNEIGHQSEPGAQPQHPRRPVGGVAVFPPPLKLQPPNEPVYAQVNRDRKKNRQTDMSSLPLLLDDHHGGTSAGDSWV